MLVHALGGEGFTHIGSLCEARWDFAAVLVDSPDGADGPVIYCFGGAGLPRSESGSSCEAFDVRKRKSHGAREDTRTRRHEDTRGGAEKRGRKSGGTPLAGTHRTHAGRKSFVVKTFYLKFLRGHFIAQ